LVGTIWLIVCLGYILVSVLRQLGIKWWIIFSLSGHSALIILLLISLYLFLIFQGIKRTTISAEHPLTSSPPYLLLYDISPLLGAFSAGIGMMGTYENSQLLLGLALGTMGATFLSWIIIDPAIALVEIILPASHKHRTERLAQAKDLRQKMQKSREQLLEKVLLKEKTSRQLWQKELMLQAKRLAEITTGNQIDFQKECEVAQIGLRAWQTGGLSCMQHLHDMAMVECKNKNMVIIDHISVLWDGIGNWQSPHLTKMITFDDKISSNRK
ncbi:MAG TPA: hypothetical protein PLP05_12685, partial [Sedimentisphaerales bacterium]|nr:hypothetical protein [Sedimentisphaerales bacterium]